MGIWMDKEDVVHTQTQAYTMDNYSAIKRMKKCH